MWRRGGDARTSAWLGVLLATAACGDAPSVPDCEALSLGGQRVLVFTRTLGFRHSSIEAGVEAVRALPIDIQVDHTDDPKWFTTDNLAQYAVIVFLNTTGDVLDDPQERAMEQYVRSGGGFVGVHSASDTEHAWPWYGQLVGAYFKSHPPIQSATLRRGAVHESTACLPSAWTRVDEWYDFDAPPPADARILLSVDESTYSGGITGDLHPVAWYRPFDGGRAWYTGLGHTIESYSDALFLTHLAGGISWAARRP